MLENLGYPVDVVPDGLQALEALSRTRYGAVLMDVQMPGMDGYEATAEIRAREARSGPRTPIIAMTANAMAGDREVALSAGMDDYVPKPVKSEELAAVLGRWIHPANGDGDAATEEAARPAEPDGQPVLDHAVIEGLRDLQEDGDPDLLAELVEVFEADVPPRVAALRGALERGDAGTIERTAHTLKGGSANLGAAKMAGTARLLEEAGRAGDLSTAPALLERLDADFEEARAALSALLLKS